METKDAVHPFSSFMVEVSYIFSPLIQFSQYPINHQLMIAHGRLTVLKIGLLTNDFSPPFSRLVTVNARARVLHSFLCYIYEVILSILFISAAPSETRIEWAEFPQVKAIQLLLVFKFTTCRNSMSVCCTHCPFLDS